MTEPVTRRDSERRQRTSDTVQKLVAERAEMLVLFCRVAGLEPYTDRGTVQPLLAEFCQLLVDYMAAGHFALYQRIAEGRERRMRLSETAEEVYPSIAAVTELAVRFNDKYHGAPDAASLSGLGEDLSALGEALATRIELEDRLIRLLI